MANSDSKAVKVTGTHGYRMTTTLTILQLTKQYLSQDGSLDKP